MRRSLSHAWLLAGAVLVLAVFAATVSSALATSATSTANGLAVTASLSPHAVTKGQTVTQSETVKSVGNSWVVLLCRAAVEGQPLADRDRRQRVTGNGAQASASITVN